MAIVRQMPGLYLRGSLANVTMKNLTEEEIQFCENLTNLVASHDKMKKHKFKVAQTLGKTIKGDYASDRETAFQEFNIAIWRGVVNLFYHRHYRFRCMSCDSTHKVTKTTGLTKPIDQAHTPCPVCNCVKVTDPGDTDYEVGQFVDHDEFQQSYAEFQTGIPKCDSTIVAIPGGGASKEELDELLAEGKISQVAYERRLNQFRYDDPYAIIEDDDQMVKFFGEFVWGYFKQQLRENSRVEHNKKPTRIYGPADEVLVEEILAAAKKWKVQASFCRDTQPENGWYNIQLIGLQTPPEFTGDLMMLMDKAQRSDVRVRVKSGVVRVECNPAAPQIEALVSKPEHVMVLDNNASISDDDDGKTFSIQQVSFKTVGGCKVDPDDESDKIDREDVMRAIYGSLPDGDCRKIFEICKQEGPAYEEFRQEYDYDGEPKQTHMAKHLGITPRSVKNHLANIRHICLVHEFVPAEVAR